MNYLKSKVSGYTAILKTMLGMKVNYKIGNGRLTLPANHMLPVYQKAHPFYDRFLPHLAQYMPLNGVVIDVGANVGDTLLGMWDSNPNLTYVCIEADKEFFSDLEANVAIIAANNSDCSIYSVNEFVGSKVSKVYLQGQGGTKHAVEGGNIVSKTLDKIISDFDIKEPIKLIKSDVDGFDFDVINSAGHLLKQKPLVYFECDYRTYDQLNSFKLLIKDLIAIGYTKFALFDNFGQLIFMGGNLDQIIQLFDYTYRQNMGPCTRTIYYFDILGFTSADEGFVSEMLNSYIENKLNA